MTSRRKINIGIKDTVAYVFGVRCHICDIWKSISTEPSAQQYMYIVYSHDVENKLCVECASIYIVLLTSISLSAT